MFWPVREWNPLCGYACQAYIKNPVENLETGVKELQLVMTLLIWSLWSVPYQSIHNNILFHFSASICWFCTTVNLCILYRNTFLSGGEESVTFMKFMMAGQSGGLYTCMQLFEQMDILRQISGYFWMYTHSHIMSHKKMSAASLN